MNNKLILVVLVAFLFGCQSDEASKSSQIDEETLSKNLESAPVALVPLEQLPEWLQKRVNRYKDDPIVDLHIYKGEWKKKTIYLYKNDYQNTVTGVPYYENEEPVSMEEFYLVLNIDWVLIWYQLGKNSKNTLSSSRAKDN